ncbi:hypothetical protein MLD38_008663 [Melastoma candidum]|uniref:Uncharacterized protein n=1 Tax=Melastoma candidum TaxID=119954 RepID=A0ACB9RU68_9MYRT|nr:hypothetical protein MLD38_008663 [Melastoma candidum]
MDEVEGLLVGDEGLDVVVDYGTRVDEILAKVYELEKRVCEVEQFYNEKSQKQVRTPRGSSSSKDGKQFTSIKKLQQDASQREAAAAKRMQDLIRQLDAILQQITQHKWSPPFMQPVNADEPELNGYYKVIHKPMDIGTIRSKMEGKAYKNVREIYADVRLVFKNAMKYHNEKSDIHVKAKTLLRKFEEKWLQLLPKVTAEEKRLEQEEVENQLDLQLIHEATHARMARDISNELSEVDMHLEDLREMVLQQCRKISTEEKRNIAKALDKLPAEDVDKALEIVAEHDPSFEVKADLVDLDLDAQSESTLWRLKFFVKSALEVQEKVTPSNEHVNHNRGKNNANTSSTRKRRKEIIDAIAKSAKRRSSNP